jgi:transmembrane sensor
MEIDLKNIIPKIITGEATPDEQSFFHERIKNLPEVYEEYLQQQKVWEMGEKMTVVDSPDMDTEWLKISRKISEANVSVTKTNKLVNMLKAFGNVILNPKLKPVYAAILIVIVFLSTLFIWNPEKPVKEIFTYSTQNAERKTIDLPDGSTVTLNCGSEISFPKEFTGKERNVTLNGEAFFTVTKNLKPFVVSTENARAKVLGTEFDVWARGNETRVVVKQGVVNLSSGRKKDKGVNLVRNQASAIENEEFVKHAKEVDTDMMLGWMQGKLIFNETPATEMAEELERFYNISLNIKNAEVKNMSITGTFSSSNVDSVLTMISMALGCKYSSSNDVYFLQ